MPREPEYCREIMADILEFTGGKRRLSVTDVARFEGSDPRTAKKRYSIDPAKGIDALILAKKMCQ